MLLKNVQPYDSDVPHLPISTKTYYLLVTPTFVKRRKLICTPDNTVGKIVLTKKTFFITLA